ncbi:MAG: D-alanyl-D-alanine carboxypeptidase [Peptococcaceae bacterium]|nr:D-alanyl-D-alanine carboxypeptidase [Peptococcaceae bacterium]
MDARTGQILYDKNGRQRRPPASTTKIMTALLALEGGDLQQVVTVSPRAASVGEASLDLRAGEKLTLEELIYGAMLRSGNDACVAIAEHIAGSEAGFVLLMNQKARLIGAEDTSFKNTNGLPAPGHYTTARDLAVITRYALRNPTFQKVVRTRGKAIGEQGERYLNNTNRLLWSYAWADGVKTGTTDEAGNCLVASATRGGRQLISVVLHSDNRWNDSIRLLDYGFEDFDFVRVAEEGEAFGTIAVREGRVKEIRAVAAAELGAVIPKNRPDCLEKIVEIDRELQAPVRRGRRLGSISVLVNGERAGNVDLVADRDVERLPIYSLFNVKMTS